MEKIIIILCWLCSWQLCTGQSPVYDITDLSHQEPYELNSYIKDTHNYLNQYVGTYVGSQTLNGDIYTLTLVLQKKELNYDYDHYEDLLIGEYEVRKNGTVVYSSLDRLLMNYTNQNSHSIATNSLLFGTYLCPDCSSNEMHINDFLCESLNKSIANLFIRLATVNGQLGIEFEAVWTMREGRSNPPLPSPSFPGGTYMMVKQ